MSKTSEILALYNEQDLKARLESMLTKNFLWIFQTSWKKMMMMYLTNSN